MQHHAHNATTRMFEDLTVLVKRFPHGAHIQDKFLLILQNEFPLLLMLSFICIELIIINSIALEKERKMKVTSPDVGCRPRDSVEALMKNNQSANEAKAGRRLPRCRLQGELKGGYSFII